MPGQGSVFSVTFPIFSLPNLLAPAFNQERQTECPITLVVTEIGSQTGWLSNEVRRELCRGIRDVLRGCLYSNLDLLLPKMNSAGPAELFFIVAVTDGIGGDAICKRIRTQLDSSECLQQGGLTHSTFSRLLEPIKRKSTESIADCLARVATDIEELMNKEISSRQGSNG
jgi:hypothetical protein